MGSEDVSLREISRENLREILALRVTSEQEAVYPQSNACSIAEGHHPPDDDPVWMRAIYAGDDPVGFLMTSEVPDRGEYFLWRLMIDAAAQGSGYGARAVELLIERIGATPNAKELLTTAISRVIATRAVSTRSWVSSTRARSWANAIGSWS